MWGGGPGSGIGDWGQVLTWGGAWLRHWRQDLAQPPPGLRAQPASTHHMLHCFPEHNLNTFTCSHSPNPQRIGKGHFSVLLGCLYQCWDRKGSLARHLEVSTPLHHHPTPPEPHGPGETRFTTKTWPPKCGHISYLGIPEDQRPPDRSFWGHAAIWPVPNLDT